MPVVVGASRANCLSRHVYILKNVLKVIKQAKDLVTKLRLRPKFTSIFFSTARQEMFDASYTVPAKRARGRPEGHSNFGMSLCLMCRGERGTSGSRFACGKCQKKGQRSKEKRTKDKVGGVQSKIELNNQPSSFQSAKFEHNGNFLVFPLRNFFSYF